MLCILASSCRCRTHPRLRHASRASGAPSAASTSASPALGIGRGYYGDCEIGQCATTTSVPPRAFSIGNRGTCERSRDDGGRGGESRTGLAPLPPRVQKQSHGGDRHSEARVRVCGEKAAAITAVAAAAAHGAPLALPGKRTPWGTRLAGAINSAVKVATRSRTELDAQASPARQGVYTHKRPLCVDGSRVSPLAARSPCLRAVPPRPGVQADALAGPEDTTLRVRPESARRCRI